jgi:hypothetical protein
MKARRDPALPHRVAHPLDDDERQGIVLAVNSAFRKLKNLYERIVPVFNDYGFTPPSPGVVARDLSEKIETSIVQHCNTFERGQGHADLHRYDKPWEVKICKDRGLTINQSKNVNGENYIVVNYLADSVVTRIWLLWDARDSFFSPRKPNTNARSIKMAAAGDHVEIIDERRIARRQASKRPDPASEPIAFERDVATRRRSSRKRR